MKAIKGILEIKVTFIMMTELLVQEDKTILNLYAPNNTASKCTK